MKKVSLITPLWEEEKLLQNGIRELESFIQKFPVAWELILIIDPSKDKTSQLAQALISQKIDVRCLQNERHLGRAQSLEKGLRHSTGDYLMSFSLDLNCPYAEIFQFLQEAVSNDDSELIFGNRNTSKKKREAHPRSTWFWTLEKILVEKWRRVDSEIQDPLCGYFLIKREALEKIRGHLKLRKWHYSLDLLSLAIDAQLNIQQIPISSKDFRPSRMNLLKEYFNNLL